MTQRSGRRALASLALLGGLAAAPGARASPPPDGAATRPPAAAPTPRGQLPFVSFGAELGLEEISPWQIAQDSAGYLWFTAETGVYRYDGRHARLFGVSEGIPGLYTTLLAIGRDDRVWCKTARGLALYHAGRWHLVGERHPDLGLDEVAGLAVDGRGRLLTATPRGLVHEGEGGELEVERGWPGGPAYSVFAEPTGAVLAGGEGAIYVREGGGDFARVGLAPVGSAERVTSVVRDGRGRVWAASQGGVVVRRPGEAHFRRWGDFAGAVTFLYLDREANPWFASERGLFSADEHERVERAERLPTRRVTGVYADREGTLWAGTGRGLARAAGRGLWRSHSEPEGLPDEALWSVRRGPDGRLWAGTQRGLAVGGAGGWQRVAAVPAEPLRGITPDREGALWLNGPVGHIYRYEPRADRVMTFDDADGLPGARTLALALDADGSVWVGTDGGGVLRGEAAGGRWRFAPATLGPEGPVKRVRDVVLDRRGQLWVTSERGLFVREGVAWRRLTTADGLRTDATMLVLDRAGGETCVGYELGNGLSCFRYEGGVPSGWWHLDARSGLASDIVYLLGEDAAGRLWAGGNAGADLIEGGRLTHFGVLDGLPHHDCNARAFWADEGGDVWVGTSRGLGQFAGARYPGPPAPPVATLRARREGAAGAMAPLAPGARLPYAPSAVEFEFSALSFLHEPAMQFETRLIAGGAGAAWAPAPNDGVRYAALGADTYEFQVRARHPGGDWGPPQALPFVVLPPWWQTTWFFAAAAGALGAALALAVRWRSAALAGRNRELERLVAERTRELTRAQAEIARAEKLSALGRVLAQLSHELNNPINVVWNNVDPLRQYVDAMVAMLSAYREGCRALPDAGAALERTWREAELDFVVPDAAAALSVIATAAARVRDLQADLAAFLRGDDGEKQRRDLNEDLRATVAMVASSLPGGVRVEAAYGPLPPVEYEPGRMNQVFLNLLQNAAYAVGGAGRIAVRTWAEGGAVRVEVADDGPGVPEALRERIFEPFFTTKPVGRGTGLGLSICRQIVVELHGGELTVGAAQPRGASFVITLPAAGAVGAPPPAPDARSAPAP
ncbi:MAG TPA: ATP-binding protein [Polyangiaceae bacterium]|nr:ATP-binding protein [Polyangiaceae bacterium]